MALGSLAIALAQGPAVAAVVTIDGFNTGSFAQVSSGPPVTISAGDAIGSWRELSVSLPGTVGSATLAAPAFGSQLAFEAVRCSDCSGRVTWDANGAGLGPINLTAGANALSLRFTSLSAMLGATLLVLDDIGNSDSVSHSVDAIFGPDASITNFSFDSFTGVDFSRVSLISLRLRTIGDFASVNAQLDSVFTDFLTAPPPPPPPGPDTNTVPLPGSLLLSTTALACAVVARRRKSSTPSVL